MSLMNFPHRFCEIPGVPEFRYGASSRFCHEDVGTNVRRLGQFDRLYFSESVPRTSCAPTDTRQRTVAVCEIKPARTLAKMHVLLAESNFCATRFCSTLVLNFRKTIMVCAFALSLTFVESEELGVESVRLCVCCHAVTVVAR